MEQKEILANLASAIIEAMTRKQRRMLKRFLKARWIFEGCGEGLSKGMAAWREV